MVVTDKARMASPQFGLGTSLGSDTVQTDRDSGQRVLYALLTWKKSQQQGVRTRQTTLELSILMLRPFPIGQAGPPPEGQGLKKGNTVLLSAHPTRRCKNGRENSVASCTGRLCVQPVVPRSPLKKANKHIPSEGYSRTKRSYAFSAYPTS